MKLKDFTKMLLTLESQGSNAEMQVYYRHGASGDCGLLSSAHVTNLVESSGPHDLAEGEFYISIYAGN
jgi:hypothetical protein